MGQYDFTYVIPQNFKTRVIQFLQQKGREDLSMAFQQSNYEYENVGNAYYAGIRGDNWNMNALDFTFEGSEKNIKLLENNKKILKEIIGKALKSQESGFQIRDIYCFVSDGVAEILPQSNEERLNVDMARANSVLKDLILISERVCTTAEYRETTKEDTINDFFRNMLCGMGYTETKDQTRHGISSSGNDAPRVDILLTKDGEEIALIEGLRLNGVTTKTIDDHIDKALNNYNSLGTATFIVAYVGVADFGKFWDNYYSYISTYNYNLTIKKNMIQLTSPNASTKIAQIIVSKDEYDFPVFFLCLKMRKN